MHRRMTQQLRTRCPVMPEVYTHVLGSRVDIAHPALQRRSLVDRAAATEAVAGLDDLDAGLGNPHRHLVPTGGPIQLLGAALERVLPVDLILLLHERARRA